MSQSQEAPPPHPRSKIPPLLQAALVCDVAVTDPSSGKASLIGIFNRIQVGTFPTARAMSVYFRFTDAEGHYAMRVDFVRAESDTLIASVEGEMDAKDRTEAMGMHYEFPPLPLPQPGRYEFRIYASDMYLGSAAIEARQRSR
jgi:hypothetical protein